MNLVRVAAVSIPVFLIAGTLITLVAQEGSKDEKQDLPPALDVQDGRTTLERRGGVEAGTTIKEEELGAGKHPVDFWDQTLVNEGSTVARAGGCEVRLGEGTTFLIKEAGLLTTVVSILDVELELERGTVLKADFGSLIVGLSNGALSAKPEADTDGNTLQLNLNGADSGGGTITTTLAEASQSLKMSQSGDGFKVEPANTQIAIDIPVGGAAIEITINGSTFRVASGTSLTITEAADGTMQVNVVSGSVAIKAGGTDQIELTTKGGGTVKFGSGTAVETTGKDSVIVNDTAVSLNADAVLGVKETSVGGDEFGNGGFPALEMTVESGAVNVVPSGNEILQVMTTAGTTAAVGPVGDQTLTGNGGALEVGYGPNNIMNVSPPPSPPAPGTVPQPPPPGVPLSGLLPGTNPVSAGFVGSGFSSGS